jgi:hypothetical protein
MAKIWTAAEMGKKGGAKSRRILTPDQAREMVATRERRKLTNNSISQSSMNSGNIADKIPS